MLFGATAAPDVAGGWRQGLVSRLLAAQGATDVLEIQLGAAHRNGELDADGLREIVVFLAHYAGWPVAARLNNVVEGLLSEGESP